MPQCASIVLKAQQIGSEMEMNRKTIIAACAFFVGIAAIIAFILSVSRAAESNSVSTSGFPVSLNEIMAANRIYYDDLGNSYDWIELSNSSSAAIDLSQYKITDSERKVRYTFPNNTTIAANGFLVIWCKNNAADGDYADFSISKAGGEAIILMNDRSVIVDRVVTVPMELNQSMGRDAAGDWSIQKNATPGYENTSAGYQAYLSARHENRFPVIINEIMVSNKSYLDANLCSSDWIEFYNTSGEAVDLSGMRLTDRDDAAGYIFPTNSIIQPYGFLLIYCDGATSDPFYAPFSLSSAGGETVMLISGNTVLDQVTTKAMQADLSLARDSSGEWVECMQPTPQYENTTEGFNQYLASLPSGETEIQITEIMASNTCCLRDEDGDFSDWIELTNTGFTPTSLAGFFLSDQEDQPNKWALPDITLQAGERIVIFASGKDRKTGAELHTNFSLNRHAGIVSLSTSIGQIISSVRYSELPDNEAFAADETTGEWRTTPYDTPGFSNDETGFEAFETTQAANASILISEAMSGNATFLKQGRNGYFDWIEIENRSAKPINLNGYRITDNLSKTNDCALPNKTLQPGGYIVLLCTGETPLARSEYSQVQLSLDAESDQLYLLNSSGEIVDYMALHDVPVGVSTGRTSEQNGVFLFDNPTPGKKNSNGYRQISPAPTASLEPGVYTSPSALTITLFSEGDIYYTTNGATPTMESSRYTEPITISSTTVIRAASVSESLMMSPCVTLNYILNTDHTLPIVAVTTDQANIYDATIGILAARNLYDRSAECPASVSFFSDQGSFSAECGLKLHGAGSRGKLFRKSFKIVFRQKYGVSALDFPLFENGDITQFDSFLIRSGEDSSRSFLRDELLTNLAIESSPELMVQNSRFCVYYLNGEYQGIYCLKEAFSSGYFARRYGVNPESVEVQRGYLSEGSEFLQLVSYASCHDLSCEEYYRYIEERVNLESLIDWSIYEGYAANHDLAVNVRYYRSAEYDNNRWHYALFDMDYGFDGPATFDYILKNYWHGTLFKRLLKNPEFCDLFLTRMAYLLENYLTEENVMGTFQALQEQIRTEIPNNQLRWGGNGIFAWERHLAKLEGFIASGRIEQMKRSIAGAMNISIDEVNQYFSKGAV